MATTDDLMKAKLKELLAKRDAQQARLAPHRKVIDDVHLEIQKLRDSLAPHADAIRAAAPAMKAVEMEISKLARALGGKSISDV